MKKPIVDTLVNSLIDVTAIVLALLVLTLAAFLSIRPAFALKSDPCSEALTLAEHDRAWRFSVYLDDKPIGCHHYYLDEQGQTYKMQSIADFEYRLLFVKLYDYEHENLETWNGGCLARIESETNANGKPFSVSGEQGDQAFLVRNGQGERSLPDCVMTFAYWNPEFLKASRLLNTQDGEYVDIEVGEALPAMIKIGGKQQMSYRYHLQAGDLEMHLWYSEEGEWLALESEARAGKILQYRRSDGPSIKPETAP